MLHLCHPDLNLSPSSVNSAALRALRCWLACTHATCRRRLSTHGLWSSRSCREQPIVQYQQKWFHMLRRFFATVRPAGLDGLIITPAAIKVCDSAVNVAALVVAPVHRFYCSG